MDEPRRIFQGRDKTVTNRPKVIVVQEGARRSYVVAKQLLCKRALVRLHTDVCFPETFRWWDQLIVKIGGLSASAVQRRTVNRELWAFVSRNLAVPLVEGLGGCISVEDKYRWGDISLGLNAIRIGTENGNLVYAMFGNGEPFLRYARKRGLKIASDVFITPIAHRIEDVERLAFPEWGESRLTERAVLAIEAKVRRMIALSDALFCPAPAVIDGLTQYGGFEESKAILVPYGSSVVFREPGAPKTGRVLFAGTVCLRKGAQYLGAAAKLLKTTSSGIQILAAGGVSDRVRALPDMHGITFLGHLGREEMNRQFLEADVFVLPSLAEGSAGVVFEAMAAGLPVVVTRGAGSIVTDGREGFVVPERDPEALATAIERIVTDRPLREAMSQASLATAALYDEAHWGDRLFAALNDVVNGVPNFK